MNSPTPKTESMVLTEAEAIELFTYLISSARTQLDDPCQYASMRLLTVAEILRDFVRARVSSDTRKLLDETAETITHAHIYMADTEDYTATLDALCRKVALFLVEQSGLKERAS